MRGDDVLAWSPVSTLIGKKRTKLDLGFITLLALLVVGWRLLWWGGQRKGEKGRLN